MKRCNIVLLTSTGAKRTEISHELLIELINNIHGSGKETVHTTHGTYEVTGLVIGDVKGKVLFL